MAATRQQYQETGSIQAQATKAEVVAPSDANDLPNGPTKALWVGGAGALAVILKDDTVSVIFSAVPAGTLLNVRVKRVLVTGTVATLMLALY